jgi:hypothetical protein
MASPQSQAPSPQSDNGIGILLDGGGPSDRHNEADREEFYFSPSISPADPWIGQNSRQAGFESVAASSKKPPVGRRLLRAAAYSSSVIIVIGAVVGWQSYGDRISTQTAWELSLSWLPSFLHTTGSEGASPEVQNRLDSIASDLTAVRRIVEQLTAKQEQTTRDIAMLQAAERNISQKFSSLPHSPVVRVPPPKNAPSIVHSEASVQPPSVPAPARGAGAQSSLH